jgi:CubicO group peptidase (beta-lactamase class C family)
MFVGKIISIVALCAFVHQISTADGVAASSLQRAPVPMSFQGGPEAEAYGQRNGYPIGPPLNGQGTIVGNYSHYDRLRTTRVILAARRPSRFARASTQLVLNYEYRGGDFTLKDYLARNPTTGLLIARNDTILYEAYQYGRTDRDRFLSQSMVKTVVAMLVGIAISEGAIHSIDDTAQRYVPELANSELGLTSLRSFLHMASGIAFRQDYSGKDDDAKLNHLLAGLSTSGIVGALLQFNTRVAPPDTHWNYSNLDTEVLGLVLIRATRSTLSQYLQTRIWQPMGAESDARWGLDSSGQEIAYAGFNASLRDYTRFGMLLARDGARNGKQIIPRQWVLDATEPVKKGSFLALNARDNPRGYGYQVWLMPGPRRMFALEGVYGQRLFIDPELKLVVVHTAVRLQPVQDPGEAELLALGRGLLNAVEHAK